MATNETWDGVERARREESRLENEESKRAVKEGWGHGRAMRI
jgi:hypothetical protein